MGCTTSKPETPQKLEEESSIGDFNIPTRLQDHEFFFCEWSEIRGDIKIPINVEPAPQPSMNDLDIITVDDTEPTVEDKNQRKVTLMWVPRGEDPIRLSQGKIKTMERNEEGHCAFLYVPESGYLKVNRPDETAAQVSPHEVILEDLSNGKVMSVDMANGKFTFQF